jgi:hypothetical protein
MLHQALSIKQEPGCDSGEDRSDGAILWAKVALLTRNRSNSLGYSIDGVQKGLADELATNPDVPSPTRYGVIEDVDHWKRRVVERCIYGVHVNPLAVELVKVRLWLSTAANNKPLSFLDHHLSGTRYHWPTLPRTRFGLTPNETRCYST